MSVIKVNFGKSIGKDLANSDVFKKSESNDLMNVRLDHFIPDQNNEVVYFNNSNSDCVLITDKVLNKTGRVGSLSRTNRELPEDWYYYAFEDYGTVFSNKLLNVTKTSVKKS